MGPIKVCVAYDHNGTRLDRYPTDTRVLEEVKPIYETLPGWTEDISGCRKFEELPAAAQDYVRYIERELNAPVKLVAVGPDRAQTIDRGMRD